MSNVANEGRLDYSKFDNIDSDVLEAYLQADFNAPEAEQMDPDAIFYILNLLEERQKNAQTELSDDTSVALERFYSDYYPTLEDEQRFLEFYNEFGKNINKPATNNTKYQPRKRVCRVFGVVTALVLFFCVGSVVCYAWGINPLKIIGIWNDDQFWFESTSVTTELADVVSNYAPDVQLVPEWLPDGYAFDTIEVSEPTDNSFGIIYAAFYKETDNGINTIDITYRFPLTGKEKPLYEKDTLGVKEYEKYGIKYYIMENLDIKKLVWRSGIYEGSITGKFSLEEAKQIINSIYGE